MRRRKRPESHRPGKHRAGPTNRLFRIPGSRDGPLGARHQEPSRVRQHEPTVRSHEEGYAEPALETAQLIRRARLRHEAGVRSGCHRPALDRGHEVAKLLESYNHPRCSMPQATVGYAGGFPQLSSCSEPGAARSRAQSRPSREHYPVERVREG